MDASTWATIEEIFRDLLIFVAFMTVLLVALVVIIHRDRYPYRANPRT